MRTMVLALACVALGGAEPPTLSRKVLEYAREHLGQQVGNGECTTLAVEALRAAGARCRPDASTEDFVWGDEVKIPDSRPGDVLQFRDAVFRGRRRLRNGGILTTTARYPHHTAIVSGVRRTDRGPVLTVLHQNVGPSANEGDRRRVQEATITMGDLQPGGVVRAFRPVAE